MIIVSEAAHEKLVEQIDIRQYPDVIAFFNNQDIEDIPNIYLVSGTIVPGEQKAYSCYCEDGGVINVLLSDGSIAPIELPKDSIAISKSQCQDDYYIETSIVHEVCHAVDGMAGVSPEDTNYAVAPTETMAQNLEREFLTFSGMAESDIQAFFQKKYRLSQ